MLKEEKIQLLNKKIIQIKKNEYRHILIWGAGEHTEKLFFDTELVNLPIKGIVDQKCDRTMLLKYPVKMAKMVDWKDVDAVIISSFKYQKEMKGNIERLEGFRGDIITLYEEDETSSFYKLQSQKSEIVWKEGFLDWQEVEKHCEEGECSTMYADNSILDNSIKTLISAPKEVEKYYHLIAYLLKIANANEGKLTVLDLGGALGHIYFSIKDFFSELDALTWIVVEQENYVAYGKKNLQDNSLQFTYSIKEAFGIASNSITIALCSSVFSYIEEWKVYLTDILQTQAKMIIVDRQLVAKRECIAAQEIRQPSEYDASYPCRILCESELLQLFESDYDIVGKIKRHKGQEVHFATQTAEFYCYIFKRKECDL